MVGIDGLDIYINKVKANLDDYISNTDIFGSVFRDILNCYYSINAVDLEKKIVLCNENFDTILNNINNCIFILDDVVTKYKRIFAEAADKININN